MRSIIAFGSGLVLLVLILGSSSYGEEFTADYWLEQANNYYSDESYDIALLSVNKSLEIDPINIEAWKVKGDSFYALGMYKDALDCYNKLTQVCPECKGHGYTTIEVREEVTLYDQEWPVTVPVTCYKTEPCWRCHGARMVRGER